MNLLRRTALLVPPIRRLRDERDALLAQTRGEGRLIVTDYPYDPHKRSIEDAAGGKRLIARLQAEEDRYAATLHGMARHVDSLLRIPSAQEDPSRPYWVNDWFPPFDGASLYGLIAERSPRRYIEVGSGISTRFATRSFAVGWRRSRVNSGQRSAPKTWYSSITAIAVSRVPT